MKTYFQEDLTYTPETLPPILKWVTPHSRVLEFGPAFGYMTHYLSEQLECDVVCIELNPEMKPTLERFAKKVIIANLDEDEWEKELDGHFDFVIFADVLEHLRDPQRVLQIATKYGDCILTSVPNIGHSSIILSLLDGEFQYQKYGLLDDSHIHFFTRKSLENMAFECGLTCKDNHDTLLLYPSSSEFHKYYTSHLNAAWSIARTPDSAIYQFVDKWKKNDEGTKSYKRRPYKPSLFLFIKIILFEWIRRFVFSNKHLRESNRIRQTWHKFRDDL